MSYLLLCDKNQCPKCRYEPVPASLPSQCRGCGMMLFKSTDSLNKYESETGLREYWVWTVQQEGWKHRSVIMNPSAKPQERELKEWDRPDNYGTQDYQKQRIADCYSHRNVK